MFFVLSAMVGRAEMSASFIGTTRWGMVHMCYNIFSLKERLDWANVVKEAKEGKIIYTNKDKFILLKKKGEILCRLSP
jgi:hypothetical protein